MSFEFPSHLEVVSKGVDGSMTLHDTNTNNTFHITTRAASTANTDQWNAFCDRLSQRLQLPDLTRVHNKTIYLDETGERNFTFSIETSNPVLKKFMSFFSKKEESGIELKFEHVTTTEWKQWLEEGLKSGASPKERMDHFQKKLDQVRLIHHLSPQSFLHLVEALDDKNKELHLPWNEDLIGQLNIPMSKVTAQILYDYLDKAYPYHYSELKEALQNR